MQEFFGLAYFAEIPVVVFDVQRGGPSAGMPTRAQQSDLLSCAFASHGDTKHVLLIPDGPNEAFEFAARAFDLAERLQTVVFVMLDLDIEIIRTSARRSNGMTPASTTGARFSRSTSWRRHRISAATTMSTATEFPIGRFPAPIRPAAPVHRGTSRDPVRALHRGRPALYRQHGAAGAQVRNRARLAAAAVLKRATKPTRVGVLQYGSTSASMDEAQKMLADEGLHVDTLRIRAFPMTREVEEFIASHDRIFVVEQNRDAQMRTLISTDLGVATSRWTPILHFNGMPTSARFIYRRNAGRVCARPPQRNPRGRQVTYLASRKFPPSLDPGERARLHPPRLRRLDVDALRRLRA